MFIADSAQLRKNEAHGAFEVREIGSALRFAEVAPTAHE